jgi:hypothetical protein
MPGSARFASVPHPASAKFLLRSPEPIQQVLALGDYIDRTGFVDAKDPRHPRFVPPGLLQSVGFAALGRLSGNGIVGSTRRYRELALFL